MADAKGLGGRLYRARMNASRPGHRVTQDAVGAEVGVSGVAVGAWEKGTSKPDVEIIPKLAAFLGVSAAWLAWGDVADQNKSERTITGTLTGITPDQVRPGKPARKKNAG